MVTRTRADVPETVAILIAIDTLLPPDIDVKPVREIQPGLAHLENSSKRSIWGLPQGDHPNPAQCTEVQFKDGQMAFAKMTTWGQPAIVLA